MLSWFTRRSLTMLSGSQQLKYVTPEELREWVAARRERVRIVDVRDEDFVGGHIPGAVNCPSEHFAEEEYVSSLVDELTGQEVVVFHCMKSQVRGPSCATRYLAALSRAEEAAAGQEVLVLQGGFERWRMMYSEEPGLIAAGEDEKAA